jgi:cell division protein FtsI/penicillin-binding protein 2
MAAGLDSRKINIGTKFTDKGYVVVDGVKISNSTPGAHGEQSMSFVLEQSLNTGTTFIQQKLGKSIFYDYIKNFGFGDSTGIGFDDEATGVVYKPDDVGELGYATMSFGQGISTSPLQMLSAFATIANGGEMVRPFIVDRIVNPDGDETVTEAKTVRRVVSEETAAETTKMLVSVVEKGHGFQAKIKGYKIAGKTGTAQIPKEDGSGYEENKNIGTFVGYPVAENANFVILAKIDSPKGVPWAEESAAPLVGQLIDFLLKYYQIPPTEPIT